MMLAFRILMLLLAALGFVRIASCIPSSSNQSHELVPRQCVWVEEVGGWKCNEYLPTLAQIIHRLRDTANGGNVTPEKPTFFYTGLWVGVQNPTQAVVQEAMSWCIGWLANNGHKEYVFNMNALNSQWLRATRDFILTGDKQKEFEAKWGTVKAAHTLSSSVGFKVWQWPRHIRRYTSSHPETSRGAQAHTGIWSNFGP
jgi:hypothetical protein